MSTPSGYTGDKQASCVFILGCDRSGTTLLQNILNAHPDIFITYEEGIIYPLKWIYDNQGLDALIEKLYRREMISEKEKYYEYMRNKARTGNKSFSDLVSKAYSDRCSNLGKIIWGDKNPRYTDQVDDLASLFPNAKFINIVRDPRPVALSWEKTDWGPMTAYRAAKLWRTKINNARFSFEKLKHENNMTITFEDLVNKPEETTKSLCAYLGVEFNPLMLQKSQRAKSQHALSENLEKLHVKQSKEFDRDRLEAWKSTPALKLSHIESACWDEMNFYNYLPVSQQPARITILWKMKYLLTEIKRKLETKKLRDIISDLRIKYKIKNYND